MKVICNILIAIEANTDTKEEAIEWAENVELPKEYVEDSFEIVQVLDDDGKEI